MPFNGSGVFTRLYDWTDDRDAAVKINADRTDAETDGIVAGINALTDGTQGFIAPVRGSNGTAAAPGHSFTDDTDTGMYRSAADTLGFAVAGTLEGKFEAGFFDAVNGLKIGGTAVTATAAELNYLDITTLGTSEASKAVTADANGDVKFANAIVETVYAVSGTTPALDPNNGTIQTWTLSGNSTPTDSFAAGEAVTFMIDDGTAYSITWPSVTWVNNGGSAPTLATTGYTVVSLWKVGSTLYGALVGDGS